MPHLRASSGGRLAVRGDVGRELARASRALLVVVDPIDGTRAFARGDPIWAISVALVVDGRPLIGGSSMRPRSARLMSPRDGGAASMARPSRFGLPVDPRRLSATGPKAILQAMEAKLGATVEISPRAPSLAYRLCLAARGAVHFAVAAGNSHDWDVAAADLLLQEAGGRLVDVSGERLT